MRDEDIDFSDAPELGPDFFKNAIIWPGPKKQITLRVDPDVLTFFRKHGRGYQTTMNAVLRRYMETRKQSQRASPQCFSFRTSSARASRYCKESRRASY